MKRIKKVVVVGMTVSMLAGMNMTAIAADTVDGEATITVIDAENAILTYAQVIERDPTTLTGWSIVSGYESIFTSFGDDEQSQIKGYIAASESARAAAVKAAVESSQLTVNTEFNANTTFKKAGLYLICATEDGYSYNPMLAYIGFDGNTGEQMGLASTEIVAKKTPITISKEIADGGDYIAVGDKVDYTLEATVPYVPYGTSDPKFEISDKLTNGKYFIGEDGKNNVVVKLGETVIEPKSLTISETEFKVDLSDLIVLSEDEDEHNKNANKKVIITYSAIATGGGNLENEAKIGDNTATDVTSYVSDIEITKYNEAGLSEDKQLKLAGASFVIQSPSGKYAVISGNEVTGWVANYNESCYATTDSTGTVTVSGFDRDVDYEVIEVVAPKGYSIDPDPHTAEWDPTISLEDHPDEQVARVTVHDSTLSKLPYAGGSGTAAFTGFGVILMSLAASLYFFTKKNKETK